MTYYSEHDWKERWEDVYPHCKFNKSDIVLDIGCAGGKIAEQMAKYVQRVAGVDSVYSEIEEAVKLKIPNAFFSQRSAQQTMCCGYDIIMYLGVHHKMNLNNRVQVISHIMAGAKKQVIVRTLLKYGLEIIETATFNNFSVLCPKSNIGQLFICNKEP